MEKQKTEFGKLYEKLHTNFGRLKSQYNEHEKEGKELKEHDRDDLDILEREESVEANLQAQLQQKEEVIFEINKAANNLYVAAIGTV